MKIKKIIIVATMLLSFLLITVTALAMQSSSGKTVNDKPQPVQNSIETILSAAPFISKSAVLPGSSTISNEKDGQISEEDKPQLAQSYTEESR